ncbi:unnamed protein product [Camellia sinensis]
MKSRNPLQMISLSPTIHSPNSNQMAKDDDQPLNPLLNHPDCQVTDALELQSCASRTKLSMSTQQLSDYMRGKHRDIQESVFEYFNFRPDLQTPVEFSKDDHRELCMSPLLGLVREARIRPFRGKTFDDKNWSSHGPYEQGLGKILPHICKQSDFTSNNASLCQNRHCCFPVGVSKKNCSPTINQTYCIRSLSKIGCHSTTSCSRDSLAKLDVVRVSAAASRTTTSNFAKASYAIGLADCEAAILLADTHWKAATLILAKAGIVACAVGLFADMEKDLPLLLFMGAMAATIFIIITAMATGRVNNNGDPTAPGDVPSSVVPRVAHIADRSSEYGVNVARTIFRVSAAAGHTTTSNFAKASYAIGLVDSGATILLADTHWKAATPILTKAGIVACVIGVLADMRMDLPLPLFMGAMIAAIFIIIAAMVFAKRLA